MTGVRWTFTVLGLFVFTAAVPLKAAEGKEQFKKANELYMKGQYEEARQAYQELLASYPGSAELHYNLGNAYFKAKHLGPAILEYKRAKRLKPRDYDINENLSYAQGLIDYKVEDKRNWYRVQWERLVGFFSWHQFLFFSLSVYFLLILLLTLRFSLRRELRIFRWSGALFGLFLVSVLPLASKYWMDHRSREAVIVTSKAEVRYGPSSSDKVAFRLVEGITVRVQETRGDWCLVGLANGDSGWCEKNDLGII